MAELGLSPLVTAIALLVVALLHQGSSQSEYVCMAERPINIVCLGRAHVPFPTRVDASDGLLGSVSTCGCALPLTFCDHA